MLDLLLCDDLLGGKIVHDKLMIACIGLTEVGKMMMLGFAEACPENYRMKI